MIDFVTGRCAFRNGWWRATSSGATMMELPWISMPDRRLAPLGVVSFDRQAAFAPDEASNHPSVPMATRGWASRWVCFGGPVDTAAAQVNWAP